MRLARLRWTFAALCLLVIDCQAVEQRVIDEIRDILRRNALHPPGAGQLAALRADNLTKGLRALDPWAERVEAQPEPEPGAADAVGIGAELYSEAGRFWLLPDAGGPLMRAGVMDRAILQSVNGRAVTGDSAQEIARLLKGLTGERLVLGLCGPRCEATRDYVVTLEAFQPSSVELLRSGERPVIRIRRFVDSETRHFLQSLLANLDSAQPLLLDLRDCQGGDLFEALDSAALFTEAGAVLAHLLGRDGAMRSYRSSQGFKYVRPVVVLIGADTASAGEVFAGILQASGRAELLGRTSRGKCVSQTSAHLADGSQLFYTNREIRFADGSSCEGSGLQPDHVINATWLIDIMALVERSDPK